MRLLDRTNPGRRRTYALIALGLVISLSMGQLYISVIHIPRFTRIFRDMMDGKPLPELTAAIISYRWVLVCLASVIPVVASFIVWRRGSTGYLFVLLALLLLQIALVVIGLFLPLFRFISLVNAGPA